MKPVPTLAIQRTRSVASCALRAAAAMQARPEAIPGLRAAPGSSTPLPATFLKHADEQTVVGLAAVFRAIDQGNLASMSFAKWGVLAAPRFFGREIVAVALQRFAVEGAWGVSPHLIPHRSLHSMSGTVSQALGIHGPNLGIGGGPHSAGEAFLTAAALLAEERVSGVWVVLTGWDPEPIPEGSTNHAAPRSPAAPSICTAVALALTPDEPTWAGSRLRVEPGSAEGAEPTHERTVLCAEDLHERIAHPHSGETSWSLGCGGTLDLEW